ncbi:MAG: hypothetical protein Q9225_007711 [Loekoesia sp. 1 TL-2023]
MSQLKSSFDTFDVGRYSFSDPQQAGQCQKTIEDFMVLVEDNALQSSEGAQSMEEFCKFIEHPNVWHLAEMVVPQLRQSRLENEQADKDGDFTCLNYILDHLTRLPIRNDDHVMTTEQEMLRARFRLWARYVLTAGNSDMDMKPGDEELVEECLPILDAFPNERTRTKAHTTRMNKRQDGGQRVQVESGDDVEEHNPLTKPKSGPRKGKGKKGQD